MSAPPEMRVGWCPGALRPMMSGDGLIVRVKPRGMALTLARAAQIAAMAARHGNGLLDLTARANLQIRGVSESGLPALTVELDALGLLDTDAGAEARRNVVASPLMGLDPAAAFDIRPVVAALEERLSGDTGLAAVPSKFGVAVSDGGILPLDGVSADIRFDAMPNGLFELRLDGGECAVATCAAEVVPEVASRIARGFVEASGADAGLHRMRDLVRAVGAVAVVARAGLERFDPAQRATEPRPSPVIPRCIGHFADGFLGLAAPFGRLDAAQLDILADGARRAGASELRTTPWRAVLVPGLTPAVATRLADVCAAAGWIVDPADPRLRVAACTGAPGCNRGTTPVLDHAARWARLLGFGEPADGVVLHVSGCAKGCAHPGAASFTLVAAEGRYGLVADGTAGDDLVAAGLDEEEAFRLLKTTLKWDRHP